MSENLISENENAASQPAAAVTTTEAVTALIKIEGQEFPLDAAIAKDDELLKAALSPHYPSIRNANISRETAATTGRLIVSIVKRAEHKGVCGKR